MTYSFHTDEFELAYTESQNDQSVLWENHCHAKFEMIAEKVCEHYNIETDLIYGKSRKREISDARQIVMFLAKKLTQLSSTNIGTRLSRNHATVLHACKTISNLADTDKQFRSELNEIEQTLQSA